MGLLGYEDEDISKGLLSFGQWASNKKPFLGLLTALAAADQSKAGRQELLRQRDIDERKLKLEEALKQAQIGEYNAQAAQRQAEIDKMRRAEAEGQRVQGVITGALSPIRGIEANVQSGIVGPRPEALDVVGKQKPLDFQSLYAQGVPAARLEELAKLSTLGMPTVARTLERDDGRGGKETIQLDAQGRIVGQGIPAYIAPVQVNQGDRTTFVRPNAGVSLPINMSPAERDASARGWTSIADARRNGGEKAPSGYRFKEDGSLEAIPGGPASGAKGLTESQAKATAFLGQMRATSETLKQIAPDQSNWWEQANVGMASTPGANIFASDKGQQIRQAQEQWAEAFLRFKTGAAATEAEVKRNVRTYFPQFGDRPEVIEQKARMREQAEADIALVAGKGADKASVVPSIANRQAGVTRISGDDEYNKLPSGAEFIGPDGVRRRKP